jgi:hypothetical protein
MARTDERHLLSKPLNHRPNHRPRRGDSRVRRDINLPAKMEPEFETASLHRNIATCVRSDPSGGKKEADTRPDLRGGWLMGKSHNALSANRDAAEPSH